MGLSSKMGHLLDKLVDGFAWVGGLLMMFSLITVCIDVVMRYFFNNPIGWVLQFSEYILLYIPFLAAAYVLKQENHIRVDVILVLLNQKSQYLLNMVTSLLSAGVLLVLTYYGTIVTLDYYRRGVPTLKYLKIPEYPVVMIIPIGCLLFSIQFIRRARQFFKEFKIRTEKED